MCVCRKGEGVESKGMKRSRMDVNFNRAIRGDWWKDRGTVRRDNRRRIERS